MLRTSPRSRRTAPLLAAGALLASLWTGTPAASATAVPFAAPAAVAVSVLHWDDDHDDWDDEDYRHGHWDDDLEDYPYCDRRGNGYGCPEYGYPPQR